MMNSPDCPIVSDPAPEILRRTDARISTKIVVSNNFVEMGIVVLANIVLVVRSVMLNRGDRSLSIKRTIPMGYYEAKMAVRSANSSPFPQGQEGVGDVLKAMR
jgi:hypothetical protein